MMKIYTLNREVTVAQPIEKVFAFFERPENLAELTPRALDFTILTPGPLNMKAGLVIDYALRVMGFRTFWRTLITEYDPPRRFVDLQLKGPYTFWHHTHSFVAWEGGTKITDEVEYVLPFGPLGRLAHAAVIRRQLEHIFSYRAEVIRKKFA
jgi:ligand-binding SRPBCC domain-containing protein